jgi:hypothetical protein
MTNITNWISNIEWMVVVILDTSHSDQSFHSYHTLQDFKCFAYIFPLVLTHNDPGRYTGTYAILSSHSRKLKLPQVLKVLLWRYYRCWEPTSWGPDGLVWFGFWQYWRLNSGLCAGSAGTLPLKPCLQPFSALVIFHRGSCFCPGQPWTLTLSYLPSTDFDSQACAHHS